MELDQIVPDVLREQSYYVFPVRHEKKLGLERRKEEDS